MISACVCVCCVVIGEIEAETDVVVIESLTEVVTIGLAQFDMKVVLHR